MVLDLLFICFFLKFFRQQQNRNKFNFLFIFLSILPGFLFEFFFKPLIYANVCVCVCLCMRACLSLCLCRFVCVCVYKLCFYITTCLIRLNYCEQLLYDVLLWNVWGQSKLNSSLVYPRKQNKKRLFIIHRVLKSFVLFFLHIIFADYTERTFAYSCWLWENI